jgi:hypothetical protein
MTIWYILYSFGTFFPVLVSCTEKNLATLDGIGIGFGILTVPSQRIVVYGTLKSGSA